MSDKSYVTLEQHQCKVCGCVFDTGAILMDRRLKSTFEYKTITGVGLCPPHQKLKDDGYYALVVIDPERSSKPARDGKMDPSNVYRTGELMHIRHTAAARIFCDVDLKGDVGFIDQEAADKVKAMMPKEAA